MRAHNTTDLTYDRVHFTFHGVCILRIYHFRRFHASKFEDAGANGVEVFTSDVFTDVQSCIMQCHLHWCAGDSLTTSLYFSTLILFLCSCTIVRAGDLCLLMHCHTCHRRFLSHSCKAVTTFRSAARAAMLCSHFHSKER